MYRESNVNQLLHLKRLISVHSLGGRREWLSVEEEVEEEEEEVASVVEEVAAVTEVALIAVDEVALHGEVDEEASTEADTTRGLQKG